MADTDDEINAKAQKYGWDAATVAHLKGLRGDIPSTPHPLAQQNSDPYQNYAEKVNDPQRVNMSEGGEVNPRLEALKRLKK